MAWLLEQGYLALDGSVAVRLRRVGGVAAVLTIKAGAGARRTEVEWIADATQFDALWPLTQGRRVVKTRHEVPVEAHVATVDVFDDALIGLRLVEVEFTDDAMMDAFDPPTWFGVEVTEDRRYANAALASDGLPGRERP